MIELALFLYSKEHRSLGFYLSPNDIAVIAQSMVELNPLGDSSWT